MLKLNTPHKPCILSPIWIEVVVRRGLIYSKDLLSRQLPGLDWLILHKVAM